MTEYRAWDKSRHRMASVYNLDFNNQKATLAFHDPFFIEGCIPFDDIILMKYIGVPDKNNNPIREGDIVKYGRSAIPYVVRYYNAGFVLWRDDSGMESIFINDGIECGLEILGDIYQNPELLEGKGNKSITHD